MRAFRLSFRSSMRAFRLSFRSSMRAFVEHELPMMVAQSAATDRMIVMRSERPMSVTYHGPRFPARPAGGPARRRLETCRSDYGWPELAGAGLAGAGRGWPGVV